MIVKKPSQLQVLVYAATLAVIIILTRWTRPQAPAAAIVPTPSAEETS